ncbi:MAG: TIGR03618 family F420-dependent PPOX class oxidoreductase [Chloroflexi bacterium]|nr:TIGR03618 family F420-dependent PPOX class oxidoreductase [Chloroflexota bacterium]
MASVPADFADLCGAPHFAHVVTVNRDGSPQSSPVWFRPEVVNADGSIESVYFSTGKRFRKSLNIQREPRVAISVHDESNPYRTLEIAGTASLSARSDWDDVDVISQTYIGTDYPGKGDANADGWGVTVDIERVVTLDFAPGEVLEPPPAGTDLLNPPHFAHIATVSSSGQPRSSIVWHRRAAGGENDIEFWTVPTTLKVLHLRRNPAIAVSIHDVSNPYRYTELRGSASLTAVEGHQLLDELTPLYWKLDKYPDERNDGNDLSAGVVVRINTTHRVNYGD